MKLGSKREVDALACPPGRRDMLVFDADLTGFCLRVTEDGAKVFLLQYRRGGAVRRLRLGRYGSDLTPAQARKLAEIARGQVLAGADPAAERAAVIAAEAAEARRQRRQITADSLTLAALIDRWEREQLAHRGAKYRYEAPRALRFGLADLLQRPAHAIDAATARRALEAIPTAAAAREDKAGRAKKRGKNPSSAPDNRGQTAARRCRAYAGAMYAWALKRDLVPGNPFAGVPLASKEVRRERVLTDVELGEVWRAAGALGRPWGPYVKVLLLTLQREAEVAGMAWAELTDGLAAWELPGRRTKNGKPHTVHLAAPARAILRAVPLLAGAALVFTTTGHSPISGFGHAKARLDAAIVAARAKQAEAAGDGRAPAPWRLHDFRRTGVTMLARQGVRWEVADKILNHASGAIHGVAAIYQRYDFLAEREAALDAWAAHVLKLGAPDDPGA